jgi:hypothetical protein
MSLALLVDLWLHLFFTFETIRRSVGVTHEPAQCPGTEPPVLNGPRIETCVVLSGNRNDRRTHDLSD